jgi:hypothetical protein
MRREPTKNPHTRPAIATLERLHAELGGAIRQNKQHQKVLSGQMRHVEAVIKMLDPAYNLTGIAVKRRKPNRWFKHGTIYRRALDVLRAAEKPMTPLEIATAVFAAQGVSDADKVEVKNMSLGIHRNLKRRAGKVVERLGEGTPARWTLKKEGTGS